MNSEIQALTARIESLEGLVRTLITTIDDKTFIPPPVPFLISIPPIAQQVFPPPIIPFAQFIDNIVISDDDINYLLTESKDGYDAIKHVITTCLEQTTSNVIHTISGQKSCLWVTAVTSNTNVDIIWRKALYSDYKTLLQKIYRSLIAALQKWKSAQKTSNGTLAQYDSGLLKMYQLVVDINNPKFKLFQSWLKSRAK